MTQYMAQGQDSPISIIDLQKLKQKKEKISCLTAYDATFSTLFNQAGVDVLLVGDSLGMVIQGNRTTLSVSLKDMLYHAELVVRGSQRAFVIADLPFMTTATPEKAADNAAVLIQQAGVQMVKLEGAKIETIEFMVQQGIPVCAHLGLLPQSIHQMGQYRVQGKLISESERIFSEAIAVEAAGAQLLILECIPSALAKKITQQLSIPVIGIGAGVDCDGQVLVAYDMLGMNLQSPAKFTKNFLQQANSILEAAEHFVHEVKTEKFPTIEQSYQ